MGKCDISTSRKSLPVAALYTLTMFSSHEPTEREEEED